MTTLVLRTPPPELEALIERRRQAGVDRLDESPPVAVGAGNQTDPPKAPATRG